jgi:hypothetical protein
MAPKAIGSAAAANTSPPQPAVEDDSEEETEGDDDDHRPLQGKTDEALAGAILEVAEKPNASLATFEVAKEMLARFRKLRKRTQGVKKTEESSKGFVSVGP